MRTNGPSIRLSLTCFNCEHCVSESYRTQGDSGYDVYCIRHTLNQRKYIGISWTTPEWCPLKKEVLKEFIDNELKTL